jgi:hypothetical protein
LADCGLSAGILAAGPVRISYSFEGAEEALRITSSFPRAYQHADQVVLAELALPLQQPELHRVEPYPLRHRRVNPEAGDADALGVLSRRLRVRLDKDEDIDRLLELVRVGAQRGTAI